MKEKGKETELGIKNLIRVPESRVEHQDCCFGRIGVMPVSPCDRCDRKYTAGPTI